MSGNFLVVHVFVHVKPNRVDDFIEATRANSSASLDEPGVVRFDVIEERDDPTRFVLVEVYRDEAAAAAHKETVHYKTWRDAVAPMMDEPRTSKRYRDVAPSPERW